MVVHEGFVVLHTLDHTGEIHIIVICVIYVIYIAFSYNIKQIIENDLILSLYAVRTRENTGENTWRIPYQCNLCDKSFRCL